MGKNSTKQEKAKRNLEYAKAHKKKAAPAKRFGRPSPSPAGSMGGGTSFGGPMGAPRTMYPAVCSTCSKETTVPFEPTEGKAVQCRDCFKPKPRI